MSELILNLTPEGRAALVNAANTGTSGLLISHIGISDSDAGVSNGALRNEIKRLSTFSGEVVANDTLHVTIRDDSSAVYSLRAFAVYLQDGTLLAWYAQAVAILEKSAQAMMLLSADMQFQNLNVTTLAFGDSNWTNPVATTIVPGVLRLATDQAAQAGKSTVDAITPASLASVLNARIGEGAPSEFVKALLPLATAALIRTSLELKGAALKDEGQGNDLDADMLDGQHGDYYREWSNFTGVPPTFTPSSHTHTIDDISELPSQLDGKASKSTTLTHAGNLGTGIDLNTLTSTGIYHQSSNSAASEGENYPVPAAGMLQVYTAQGAVYQTYQHYLSAARWYRSKTGSTWSSWAKPWDQNSFDPDDKSDRTHSHTLPIDNITGLKSALDNKMEAFGSITNLDTLTGWGSFYIRESATGSPSAGGGYDATGLSLSYGLQRTQLVFRDSTNAQFRTDDGGAGEAWSDWRTLWHDGNLPVSELNVGSTVPKRNPSGDIASRLFRTEYTSTNANIGYFVTMVETGTNNNYMRPSTPAQAKAALKITTSDVSGLSDALAKKAPTASPNFSGTVKINSGPALSDAGSANNLRVTTAFGWVNIGPRAAGHCHLDTDQAAFYFSKEVQANGGFRNYSSARTKLDICDLPYGLKELRQLRPVSYRYRAEYAGSDRRRRRLGLVAEQAAPIMSEPVFDNGSEPPSMEYDQYIPVLIRAAQELDTEVNSLRAEINSLRAMVAK